MLLNTKPYLPTLAVFSLSEVKALQIFMLWLDGMLRVEKRII